MALISPIIKMLKQNEMENERLAALRDTLLPRLMSGEVDVSNIEI
jgi:type I restriction enzyme S subunit